VGSLVEEPSLLLKSSLLPFSQVLFSFLCFSYLKIHDKMAAPNGGFFIQDKLYGKAPHHESFKQLWETKWKKPVSIGVRRML
jgi:hypothetical protein